MHEQADPRTDIRQRLGQRVALQRKDGVARPNRHRSGERRALVVEGVTEQPVDHPQSVIQAPGQRRQQTQQRPGARHHASPVTGACVG